MFPSHGAGALVPGRLARRGDGRAPRSPAQAEEVTHQPVTPQWEPDFPQACPGTGAFSQGFCKLTSLPREQTLSPTICVRRNSPALLFFGFIQTAGAAAAKFVCGTGMGKAEAEPAGTGHRWWEKAPGEA